MEREMQEGNLELVYLGGWGEGETGGVGEWFAMMRHGERSRTTGLTWEQEMLEFYPDTSHC